jgi:O-antigen ligase
MSVALLFCWAMGCAQQKLVMIRWFSLYIPALLFLLLSVIQLLSGLTLDKIGTREALIKLITNIVLLFLAGQLLATASRRFWSRFGLAITVCAFVLSVFAIVQFFSRPDLLYWSVKPQWGGAAFGPYVNHNHYAGLMEMLLPIACAYLLGKKGRHPVRWLGAFAILVAFASVELSGSRGGVISLLVELAIFGAVFGRSPLFGERRAPAMAAIAILAVVVVFLWIAPPEVLARYQTLVKSPDLTLGIRKQMTIDALHTFRDYHWVGTGLGSYETVSPHYQNVLPQRIVDHAHNDFAELMAETGIAGLVLALVAIEIFFVAAFRKLKSKFDDLEGCVRLGAAVGCCGVLVHSFSDFNLHIPANAAWFVACAAISQLPYVPQLRKPATNRDRSLN